MDQQKCYREKHFSSVPLSPPYIMIGIPYSYYKKLVSEMGHTSSAAEQGIT